MYRLSHNYSNFMYIYLILKLGTKKHLSEESSVSTMADEHDLM